MEDRVFFDVNDNLEYCENFVPIFLFGVCQQFGLGSWNLRILMVPDNRLGGLDNSIILDIIDYLLCHKEHI